MIDSVLNGYGSTVTKGQGQAQVSFRAFLQPVTTKSWQNMQRVFGPLGEIPMGQYLFLGPAEQAIAAGDCLQCNQLDFIVRRADTILIGDEAVYIWGLCVQKGAEDTWLT